MTTDVDLLRRAAAQVRETAEAAPGDRSLGRWSAHLGGVFAPKDDSEDGVRWATLVDPEAAMVKPHATATHIALFDPTVALTVADWLDAHARDLASAFGRLSATDSPGDTEHPVIVARALLRESP